MCSDCVAIYKSRCAYSSGQCRFTSPYRQASKVTGSTPLASSCGIDLRTVQKWMGHEDIKTTMRYAQFVPENLFNAASVLEPAKPTKPDLKIVE